jgi:hypothetical protein
MKEILIGCIIGLFFGIIFAIHNYFKERGTKEEREQKKKESVQKEVFSTKEQTLTQLKNKGILTEQEYEEKLKKLVEDDLEKSLGDYNEYKQLKSLYNDGILTKDEFESKVENLKKILKDNQTNKKDDKQRPPQKQIIPEKTVIGVWEYENGILEFWLTGYFCHKQTNGEKQKGSWLFKNQEYNIKTKQKDFKIQGYRNNKLTVSIDNLEYECIKIKESI